MSSSYITISHLSQNFSPPFKIGRKVSPTKALADIDLSIEKGSRVALLGENGAGKTTLLKILSTSIIPSKGVVTIGKYTLGKDDSMIKSFTGFVSNDDRSFYWRLTGRQNLSFYSALYGLSPREATFKINALLSAFHIDYADLRFDTYSTGMKRKFALIRALLHDPDLLLLDEPTKSLDHSSSSQLRDHIQHHLSKGQTAIIATHNFEEAETLCDHFIVLHRGCMRGHGSLNTLQQQAGLRSSSLKDIYLELIKHA